MSLLDSISVSGTIFSLAGVILTICTLVTAKSIQRDLQRKYRLPQFLKVLKTIMTEYNDLLNRRSVLGSAEMQSVLGRLSVNLASAYVKQKTDEVNVATLACKTLLKRGVNSDTSPEQLYGLVATAISAIENRIKDNQLSAFQ